MRAIAISLTMAVLTTGCGGGAGPAPTDAGHVPDAVEAASAWLDASPGADAPASPEAGPERSVTAVELPQEDFACETDSDCCVVYGRCHDTLVLVTAKNRAQTEAAIAAMPRIPRDGGVPECWPCAPPPVEVSCQRGRCAARVVDRLTSPSELSGPHCGSRLSGTSDAGAPRAQARSSALTTIDAGAEAPPTSTFRCH